MRTWFFPILTAMLVGCAAQDSGDSGKDEEVLDGDGDGATVADDCDDADASAYPGATEACDGVDNDCDGETDEADATGTSTFYTDADGDSFGDASASMTACVQPAGTVADSTDCDDGDAAINPGATEACNDVDDNCDGSVDEGLATTDYYPDGDSDGYGDDTEMMSACADPGGMITVGGDCDDTDPGVNPGAVERCDASDVDEDCDGNADDDDSSVTETLVYYMDMDGDGYGMDTMSTDACDMPGGYVRDGGDCDDGDDGVNPAATEMCDAADTDEDCDGLVDDADDSVTGTSTWYVDTDGDGYGDDDTTMMMCDMPDGYVDNAWDPWEDVAATDLVDTTELSEVTDLVVGSDGIYAVGTNGDGDAVVVMIDATTGAVTEVYSGEPLSYPTGIARSADGSLLYVADIAADSGSRSVSGGVFEIPVDGGSATEVGTAGTIDLPVDVAVSGDGTMLYVTGLDLGGDGAIFSVDLSGGVTTEEVSGSPLSDPLSIVASADGSMVYVVDSYASHGRGALISFDTPFWTAGADLASGFGVAFPGGLALDESGETVFFSSINAGDVVAVKADASFSDVVYDATGLTPGGLGLMGEWLYVANLTDSPDITTLSY